jgi:hypothetical protein
VLLSKIHRNIRSAAPIVSRKMVITDSSWAKAGDIDPGGESLAAPRGVSDASRRCKQRPSKFFVGERFFSEMNL